MDIDDLWDRLDWLFTWESYTIKALERRAARYRNTPYGRYLESVIEARKTKALSNFRAMKAVHDYQRAVGTRPSH